MIRFRPDTDVEITVEDIKALRAEAARQGDTEMVRDCDEAIFSGRESWAWLACKQAINDARAQESK